MISFFTKTSTASIGSTYANQNQIAAAVYKTTLSIGIFYTTLQKFSAY